MSESIRTANPIFIDAPLSRRRRAALPTAREWRRHTLLFLLTMVTTTLAGIILVSTRLSEPNIAPPVAWSGYILYVPEYYLAQVGLLVREAMTHPTLLAQGVTFAGALLAILTAHEAGHYIACRRYGVDATLPFFIPAPPLFMAGTFGAFIKIKSPIPSRRALFDIGVAGPLAGFVVAIPVALAGVLTLQPSVAAPLTDGVIILNDPPLFRLMARTFGVELANAQGGPFYFAAWIGLLVTSLNLMPVGQLDGGHAIYAVFGTRAHRWLGQAAFVFAASLAVLGWMWHASPSGFLYAVLLAVMLRLRHPQPEDDTPLDGGRMIVALITFLVFALSFTPFPITIT
ncbi:MAG TPA: site-2 protease family protein [Pyrinomonadaceae bacterium]|nr:site-2 protease family protein [Pyrinomonadaceae bacterium]